MTDYRSIRDELRLVYLGYRDEIQRAEKGEIKRPDAWLVRRRFIMDAVAVVGADLNVIAANQASFEAWKGSVRC